MKVYKAILYGLIILGMGASGYIVFALTQNVLNIPATYMGIFCFGIIIITLLATIPYKWLNKKFGKPDLESKPRN